MAESTLARKKREREENDRRREEAGLPTGQPDVAFEIGPRAGETRFHGPGAPEERRIQQERLLAEQQGLPSPEIAREEAVGIEQVGAQFLGERGFFEDLSRRPERQELDQPPIGGFTPVIGPVGRAMENVLGVSVTGVAGVIAKFKKREKEKQKIFDGLDEDQIREMNTMQGIQLTPDMMGVKTEAELNTLIQNPETARERALQEIQKEVIKEGTSLNEKFGAFAEPIGSLNIFGIDIGAFIEDPKGNVDTIVSDIEKIGNIGTNWREKGATGKAGDPQILFDQLQTQEENVARLEQRLALLISESPILQANGDEINRIETSLLDAKTRIFDAKQAVAFGIVAPAAEGNIFRTLFEVKQRQFG